MKQVKGLTNKQRAFVKHIIDNPKASNAEAAAQSYNLSNRNTARVVAAQNLMKPNIRSALANYTELVEGAITKTVSDWKDEEAPRKREIAMQNAQYIHDKIHGKAKQQIEMSTQSLVLNIDLTGKGEDNIEPLPPIPTPV